MTSTLRKAMLGIVLGLAGNTIGCVPAQVQVAATVTPRLVWVEPGIWIVEDSPYAMYYADGFYWRFANGVWYRSTYYDDGFVQVGVGFVPRVVIGAYRPIHVHYRAPVHAQVRPIHRDHRAHRH